MQSYKYFVVFNIIFCIIFIPLTIETLNFKTMCNCGQLRNEQNGVKINIGDPIPFPIALVYGIGKNPLVTVEKDNGDGTFDALPLVYPRFKRDAQGFVTDLWIVTGGPTATDNMVVHVYPQNVVLV